MSSPLPIGEQSVISSAAGDPIILVRGLRKTYHLGEVDVPALRGVDLDVPRGEFLAVIGPSGSGKSTLFHILGGLAPPTAGEIFIDGMNLLKLTENERTEMRRTKVGFVFQKYNLLPTLDRERQYRARAVARRHRLAARRFRRHSRALGHQTAARA